MDEPTVTIPPGAPAPSLPRPPMAAVLGAVTGPQAGIDLAGCTDPDRAAGLEADVVARTVTAARQAGHPAHTVTLHWTSADGPTTHQLLQVGRQLLVLTAARFCRPETPLPVAYVLDVDDLDAYRTLLAGLLDTPVQLADRSAVPQPVQPADAAG